MANLFLHFAQIENRKRTLYIMDNSSKLLMVLLLFLVGCVEEHAIVNHGQHYQKHKDYSSLHQVVELMALDVDTSYVKTILGEPIDMGFDYRYLIDSIGSNNCVVGAVFHINEEGKIDQKWLDEICE